MCMTLILDYWETVSLTAGCNLYSTHFRLCVLTVRTAHQAGQQGGYRKDSNMYFRERDKPVVDAETFLTTTVPKILISSLIIFLNLMAIAAMCRSNNWISRGRQKGFYILPQSTQGLLHSLFVAYLSLGLLTLYSQVSLSIFVLGDYRLFEDQGKECLTVNSLMIALSLSIALHLVSLAVDRTLASYLPYGKYTSLSRGTVPLWLLSIWLPSLILGSLPLAGWKSNFSFCIFLHQFKDDYIRFVSGFYLTTLFLIPCLYLLFVIVLKPRKDPRILYRWHRKLQAHHRLTFALVLAVNIICWTPFHAYLLMACLTCSYAYLASGFTLEYLYMLALVPSIIIPLMFSIRSNAVDKCANKISKCVHFLDDDEETNNNPLAHLKKSPLFFIDDAIQQHQREIKEKDYLSSSKLYSASNSATNSHSQYYSNSNDSIKSSASGRRSLAESRFGMGKDDYEDGEVGTGTIETGSSGRTGHFFVPHYLPQPKSKRAQQMSGPSHENRDDHDVDGASSRSNNINGIIEEDQIRNYNSVSAESKSGKYNKKSGNNRHHPSSLNKGNNKIKNKKKSNKGDADVYEGLGTVRTAPLRNFCAYLNSKNSALSQHSFRSSDKPTARVNITVNGHLLPGHLLPTQLLPGHLLPKTQPRTFATHNLGHLLPTPKPRTFTTHG